MFSAPNELNQAENLKKDNCVARPDKAQAGSTKAGSTKAGSTKAGPTKAGSSKAGPTKAGSTKAGPTKAGSTKMSVFAHLIKDKIKHGYLATKLLGWNLQRYWTHLMRDPWLTPI